MNVKACNLMICLAVPLLVGPTALAEPTNSECSTAHGVGFLEMMAWRDDQPAERYGGSVWLTVEACDDGSLSCDAAHLVPDGPLGQAFSASVTETADGTWASVSVDGEHYDRLREDPVYENDCTALEDLTGLSVDLSFSVESGSGDVAFTGSAWGHAAPLV